jgi:cytochrome c553
MAKRILAALATVLISIFAALPALAQIAKAHAPVDLNARLMQLQSSPRQLDALYKAGSKVAAICANCHGEGGNSTKPDIPNLAGQNPSYLLEQMRQFSAGERKNEFMEGMIKALSPDDKLGMVVFYSKQEVTHKPLANAALASRGQAYFSKICFQCHGAEGRGNEKIARIAGQQLNYLNLTLKRYRDGSHVRNNPLMAATTRPMTDADIAAVAAYVSSIE